MPESKPVTTVDVVIATFNEQAMIGQCLESLVAQTYPSTLVSVFVVDNESTDLTRDVAGRYPVSTIVEGRRGAAAARNQGILAGKGELLAFLDGHCVASPEWIAAMVERFADERVAAVQGCTQLMATNDQVARHIELTGLIENEAVLDATLRAETNIYPWILSGNSMFRRSVLEEVGLFDESLPACEDVDLSWRVVLAGYQLDYADRARVVHWNHDTWDQYLRKAHQQGRGAAVLANRYLSLGARTAFGPVTRTQGDVRDLVAMQYEAGYREEELRLSSDAVAGHTIGDPQIRAELRKPFAWAGDEWLTVSTRIVYWLRDDSSSVIVHHPTSTRIVVDASADFIWRRISAGRKRESIAFEMSQSYGIDSSTAFRDCDDFVDELLESGIVTRERR